jgi:hypothetical protein
LLIIKPSVILPLCSSPYPSPKSTIFTRSHKTKNPSPQRKGQTMTLKPKKAQNSPAKASTHRSHNNGSSFDSPTWVE